MVAPPDVVIQDLAWDSAFWERRVTRIDLDRRDLAPSSFEELLRAARDRSDFVQLLLPAARLREAQHAEAVGFRLVDVRAEVVLMRSANALGMDAPDGLRRLRPNDLPSVADLAAVCHDNSRFANDRALDPAAVRELYRRWVVRDAERDGWTIDVYEVHGKIAGYVTHGPVASGVSTIGLVGVAPESRGRGFGALLVAWATQRQLSAGALLMSVVTQGGSESAMATYRRLNYAVQTLGLWLHWHRQEET